MVLGNHGATVRRLCGRRTVSLKDNQPLAMQGKKKEAQQRTFPMIYLLIHLRNGADAVGRGVKQLAAGAVNTGSSVKDRDRGAMTGKFYPAKNAGGLKGKAAEGRDKQKKERCNSHKRDGRERKGGKCRSDGKEDENRTEKAGKKTFGARKTGKRMKNP